MKIFEPTITITSGLLVNMAVVFLNSPICETRRQIVACDGLIGEISRSDVPFVSYKKIKLTLTHSSCQNRGYLIQKLREDLHPKTSSAVNSQRRSNENVGFNHARRTQFWLFTSRSRIWLTQPEVALILDRFLMFLIAFTTLVLKHSFSQSRSRVVVYVRRCRNLTSFEVCVQSTTGVKTQANITSKFVINEMLLNWSGVKWFYNVARNFDRRGGGEIRGWKCNLRKCICLMFGRLSALTSLTTWMQLSHVTISVSGKFVCWRDDQQ